MGCETLWKLWDIIWISFLVIMLLWFAVMMEIVKKGSTEMLIALVISSFTLAYLPLQLNEKYGKKINLLPISQLFILSGVLMSTGFGLPFILELHNLFLFWLVHSLTLGGIVLFALSCAILLYEMKKFLKKEEKRVDKIHKLV
jgi:O-antigen ligase